MLYLYLHDIYLTAVVNDFSTDYNFTLKIYAHTILFRNAELIHQ